MLYIKSLVLICLTTGSLYLFITFIQLAFKSPSEIYLAKQENVELNVKISEFALTTIMFYKQNKFIFTRHTKI